MFKKLKDKITEEVKSSPQRIQQFAQAAQAVVTSASSSISDITNNDLFSIGDNDSQANQHNTFQNVSLAQPSTGFHSSDVVSSHDIIDSQRQRRLSNSSLASDVSFRLPSYESPSVYHLQSDMEVSASEAEERGFSSSAVSLDRVTKEQLYAAYRRTQDRYVKYRTQYADLARHYKLLERENAKARSVLVETQDKALRRISELKEQCSLEQSAKAHLEKALRIEIEEKNMKISTLDTKINFLQNRESNNDDLQCKNETININDSDDQLIDLSSGNEKQTNKNSSSTDKNALNIKIEKMEQLLNKYKDSLKAAKEKQTQTTAELQIIQCELGNKHEEIEQLKSSLTSLKEAKEKIQELNDMNEELQNKINSYEFTNTKEISSLESELQKAQEEISQLRGKVEVFSKREEEYAISLAENKLSIHKELEGKEAEIKSLKDSLSACRKEIQSLNIVINDYKNNISSLEEEKYKLKNDMNEFNLAKTKLTEFELLVKDIMQKNLALEQLKTKGEEEYLCLQLQLKQETAEKLAIIDRNVYLENRNAQLLEEIKKKATHISNLENDLAANKKDKDNSLKDYSERTQLEEEIELWKSKYNNLVSEIQEERDELVKLQSEIEKLLNNHELAQTQNSELHNLVIELKSENATLQQQVQNNFTIKKTCEVLMHNFKGLQECISILSDETHMLKEVNNEMLLNVKEKVKQFFEKQISNVNILKISYEELREKYDTTQCDLDSIKLKCESITKESNLLQEENNKLKFQIREEEIKRNSIQHKLGVITEKYESALAEVKCYENEKEHLRLRLEDLENKYRNLQAKLTQDKESHSVIVDTLDKDNLSLSNRIKGIESENALLKTELVNITQDNECHTVTIDTLEKEKSSLSRRVEDIESEKESLKTELDTIRNEYETVNENLNTLTIDKLELTKKCEDFENKLICMLKLQDDITSLSEENRILKNQCEILKNNVEELKTKNEEVSNSYAKTEIEVQKNEDNNNASNENPQTNSRQPVSFLRQNVNKDDKEDFLAKINVSESNKSQKEDLEAKIASLYLKNAEYEQEINALKERNELLQQKFDKEYDSPIFTNEPTNINDNLESYSTLKMECDLLKEENKRLHSDIEGLQNYLAKISKENSLLNDKLREFIASSENYPDKNEVADLKNEIQVDREKISDLLRENTLLVEENLELKDQLHSHVKSNERKYISNNENDSEYISMKENYNNLLDKNNKLDKRLSELDSINKSVNENMQQMQKHNEKLRLSNEKLERRLDEALVSLRHLHSLQENTELEYLRNILYEYLTGSGTHSITLAKVLSAVVKFDDTQTQLVLQKEKERQGLLRHLGLL